MAEAKAKTKTTAFIIGDVEDAEVLKWRQAHINNGHNVVMIVPPVDEAERFALSVYLTGMGAEYVHVFCDD